MPNFFTRLGDALVGLFSGSADKSSEEDEGLTCAIDPFDPRGFFWKWREGPQGSRDKVDGPFRDNACTERV